MLISLLFGTSLFVLIRLSGTVSFDTSTPPEKESKESIVNRLRHSVSVSDEPEFGRFGSLLLNNDVVVASSIWETTHWFVRDVFKDPSVLDWYVANVEGHEVVTLNAGFSCVDEGQSTASPLIWWAAKDLLPLMNLFDGPGGAEKGEGGIASIQDITAQCFKGRWSRAGLRTVHHIGQHQGEGVAFKIPTSSPSTAVEDPNFFDSILTQRNQQDGRVEVIFDTNSGVPIVEGLTFDTGFRLLTPENFTEQKTLKLRVPLTPLAAITKTTGARLSSWYGQPVHARTSRIILVLSFFSTSLAILFAVWVVVSYIAQTKIKRSKDLLSRSPEEVVLGSSGWNASERTALFIYIAGVTILAAPLGLAIANGSIDPRPSVRIASGVSILYGSPSKNLSIDHENPISGAAFVVTVFLSVQRLDNGYWSELYVSVMVILILGVLMSMIASKKSSEVIPSYRQMPGGFSLTKTLGTMMLRRISKKKGPVRRFRAYVEFRNAINDPGASLSEESAKGALLLGSLEFRSRINRYFKNRNARIMQACIRRAAGEALHAEFQGIGNFRYGIFGQVKLDNERRYEAVMVQSKSTFDRLPREWEFIRRYAVKGNMYCRSIEWYRTNGTQFPPDEALVLVRMGLLSYMKYIQRIEIYETKETHNNYDMDGVRCMVVLNQRNGGLPLIDDETSTGLSINRFDQPPRCFWEKLSGQYLRVAWPGGADGQGSVVYPEGNVMVPYFILDEDTDDTSVSTTSE